MHNFSTYLLSGSIVVFLCFKFFTYNVEPVYQEQVRITPGEVITTLEYVQPPMVEVEKSAWIDPATIPNTFPNWTFNGGDANLKQHLIDEHEVTAEQVEGWSISDLKKVHAYIHNGYKL